MINNKESFAPIEESSSLLSFDEINNLFNSETSLFEEVVDKYPLEVHMKEKVLSDLRSNTQSRVDNIKNSLVFDYLRETKDVQKDVFNVLTKGQLTI